MIQELRQTTQKALNAKNEIEKKEKQLNIEKLELQFEEFEIKYKKLIENCFEEAKKAASIGNGYMLYLYRFPETFSTEEKENFVEVAMAYFRSIGFKMFFDMRYDMVKGTSVFSGVQFEFNWAKDLTNDCKLLHTIEDNIRQLENGAGEISDGYHTFNELYHHRAILFAMICNNSDKAWKSKLHHTGDMFDGMFIVGVDTPYGQATYHYDIDPYWDIFNVKELEKAPEWDGHTPQEAINRIKKWSQDATIVNTNNITTFCQTVKVNTGRLNIRASHSRNSKCVGYLERGEKVNVIDIYCEQDGCIWGKIIRKYYTYNCKCCSFNCDGQNWICLNYCTTVKKFY